MQTHFTYDELTPLEQCIANFVARQELKKDAREPKESEKKPVLNS